MTDAYIECDEKKIAAGAISVPKLCQVVRKARCSMTTIYRSSQNKASESCEDARTSLQRFKPYDSKTKAVQGANNRRGKLKTHRFDDESMIPEKVCVWCVQNE
jgi:hypothetical protein